MGRRAVMRLERYREISRLKVLGRGEIRGQGQLLLRVILVLTSLRTRRTVAWYSVKGLELLRGHRRGRRGAGRWREVVRTGPDDPRGRLRVRAHRRVPVRYPVRRTGTVVRRGTAAVTVHGRPAKVQMRRRGQIVMMMRMRMAVVISAVMMMMMAAAATAAGVRRRSPRIRVRFDGRAPGDGPIGALGVSAGRSRAGDPARPRRRRALDYLHRAAIVAIDLDPLEPIQTILAAALSTADYRVYAEADFRLGWHRDDWRRRERHHRTIIVRFPNGQPTLAGSTEIHEAVAESSRLRSAASSRRPRRTRLPQSRSSVRSERRSSLARLFSINTAYYGYYH